MVKNKQKIYKYMSFTSMPEVNSIGGFGGFGVPGASFGGGGFGGGGILEGIILASLLGRGGRGGLLGGGEGCENGSLQADGIAAKTAMLVNQNADQNALLGAIASNNATTVAEGRALGAAICEAEKQNLNSFYGQAIQAERNTQQLSNQASAIAAIADNRFDAIERAGVAQTAAIIARINQTELDGLRDQLFGERRRGDAKEVEISINNSAVAAQAQSQAQFQVQTQRDNDLHRRLDGVFNSFNQVAKSTQDVINFGTMAASANQANQQTNVK